MGKDNQTRACPRPGWLAVVLAGVACGGTDVPDFQPRLEADVVDMVTIRYVGDALFSTSYNIRTDLPHFGLSSQNRQKVGLATEGYESMGVTGARERPRVGSYRVGEWPSSLGADGTLWLMYKRVINGLDEEYSSIGGTLEITYSSSQRLEGSFDVQEGFIAIDSIKAGSCYPGELDHSLPTVRIVGSFIAKKKPPLVFP